METIPLIDDDSGIGIGPGVVVVDLSAVRATSLSRGTFAEAFDEAAAQQAEADRTPEDVLGDLDLSPL